MQITVVNCKKEVSQFVGRPSILGNPFYMKDENMRDEVCDKYKIWLDNKIKNNDPNVMEELRRLRALAEKVHLKLGCFCSPKRCHADYIKEIIINM